MVSETVLPGRDSAQQAAGPQEGVTAAGRKRVRARGRGRWAVLGIVVVVVGGALPAWWAGAFSQAALSGAGQQEAPAPTTAVVVREDIEAVTPVPATLGYAGSYAVTGQGGGTLTWLPQPGQVISQGQVLYETGNGSPVVLLYGTVPDWRALGEGLSGADVSQLNHDLVALGDASGSQISTLGWDYYSQETAYAVQQMEEHVGISSPAGSLSLGQVVFEPQALRVDQVTGALGGSASGPVLAATSDEQVVTVALDTSQEGEVKAGDHVSVTLPDGSATPGVVSLVGTVATTSASASGETATTIPVTVRLSDPAAAGSLDQAPVTVYITTSVARGVLAVPVAALLARSPGGYVVEVAGPGSTRKYVPVTPGVFDDNSGMVQVTGNLTPGQRVVVASS